MATLEDVTNVLADRALLLHQLDSFPNDDNDHLKVSTTGDNDTTRMEVDHHHEQNNANTLFVDELLQHIPTFQYGMDVNPHFTQGIDGYEYTSQLTAFDLLRVKLVHGWLIDPQQEETHTAIGRDSYNALVERIIQGSEASAELEQIHRQIRHCLGDNDADQNYQTGRAEEEEEEKTEIQGIEVVDVPDDDPMIVSNDENPDPTVGSPSLPPPPSKSAKSTPPHASTSVERELHELYAKSERLSRLATEGSIINDFLNSTSHQLTVFGLQVLHDELKEDELVVFFRNNHFGTLTKHQGS